ncbi:MAG TPA: efflux RND transporter permease subunit [Polyangiaceae bacterium]
MLRIVNLSARRPLVVLLATAVVVIGCVFAQRKLARDAIPDLSDPQIVLLAEWMGHPASEVSERLTSTLETALQNVPGAKAVRGASMSGMSYVAVVFESAAALPPGRAEIDRRVEKLRPRLPSGARVRVGHEASSTGWVLQYALLPPEQTQKMPMAEAKHDRSTRLLTSLRLFQDQVLGPALTKVPGVAEVAPLGGHPEEVLIETTADQLRVTGVAYSDVVASVGAALEKEPDASLARVESTAIEAQGATAVRLGEVARVKVAPDMASGVADVDGATRAIGGIVIAKRDADVRAVIDGVKQVLANERAKLPPGARLGVVYDRSELAQGVERTLLRAVGEEVAVVALVVLLFLLHLRSALLPILTLPLVVLLTFAAMRLFDVPATIMSLGGIAIALGLAVDAELVALDACHRRLEADGAGSAPTGAERRARLVAASSTFAPAILISLLIAAIAFVPVFAFGGETGRLLRPLAVTKTVVIVAAALVALTTAPALRDWLLRGRVVAELDNPLTRGLVRLYRPFVNFALARPSFTLATAFLFALSCLPIIPRLGSEFLPRIDEGDLLYMPTTRAGLSPEEAARELERQDLDIAEQPEVALTFGKIGRAETATDPASFSMSETTIRLKPRAQWPTVYRPRWYSSFAPEPLKRVLGLVWPEWTPRTTAEVMDKLDRATRFPGWTNAWTAPVRARMDMMATGVRTPVGIRIVAPDPARLDQLGAAVEQAASRVPGTRSATYESSGGETRLTFVPDEAAMTRHGVDAKLVQSTVEFFLAGGRWGELRSPSGNGGGESRRLRLSLVAPWLPKQPDDVLRDITVRSGADHRGPPVPLGMLGRPAYVNEPAMLRSESGELSAYVHVDVADGTDLAGFVRTARAEVENSLAAGTARLRSGERIEWTGQYPLIIAGERRLALIAPLVALSMLGLLFLQFRSLIKAAIVLVSVPFALVGSFWTLYLLDYRLSAPVWVGLLSVVGLAMQTGVLMVVYIDEAYQRRVKAGRMHTRQDIIEAHAEGTVLRLRPKIMTIVTMGACLMPLLWADGAGSEIMRRIAAPMIGGLVTSTFLTLEVLPVLYTIWRSHQLEALRRQQVPLEARVENVPT